MLSVHWNILQRIVSVVNKVYPMRHLCIRNSILWDPPCLLGHKGSWKKTNVLKLSLMPSNQKTKPVTIIVRKLWNLFWLRGNHIWIGPSASVHCFDSGYISYSKRSQFFNMVKMCCGLTFVKAQIFSEFFTENAGFDLIKFEEKLFENSPYRWRLGVRQTKSFLSSSDLRGDKTNASNKFLWFAFEMAKGEQELVNIQRVPAC